MQNTEIHTQNVYKSCYKFFFFQEFLAMANIHPNPKDSPSGLSTQDSTVMYSLINSQTLPLTREHSKSLLPIQPASGSLDLHRPVSDPGLPKDQH